MDIRERPKACAVVVLRIILTVAAIDLAVIVITVGRIAGIVIRRVIRLIV